MDQRETPEAPAPGSTSRWRLAAGALLLAAMIVVFAMMAPPYIDNFRLQRSLEEFVAASASRAMTEDVIRAKVADRAAQLGLPLPPNQVRVDKDADHLRVEVLYAVRVDLFVYSVDLHFHPAAGSR